MAYDQNSLGDYVDVAERIRLFRAAYPTGCLRPVNPSDPYDIVTVEDKTFIVYAAAAYRTPDDVLPGIGIAWEPFPGRTPFTAGSELMNAETAAWGRAIIASLAADSKKIASLDEVRARRETKQDPHPATEPRQTRPEAPQAAGNTERAENVRPATDGQERTLYAISKSLDKLPPAKGSLSFSEASAMIDALKEEQIRRAEGDES